MKASVLSKKQVINACDGQCLGRVVDFEFDPCNFQIEALCVQRKKKFYINWFYNYFVETKTIISVNRVQSIGIDVVIVDEHRKNRDDNCK